MSAKVWRIPSGKNEGRTLQEALSASEYPDAWLEWATQRSPFPREALAEAKRLKLAKA